MTILNMTYGQGNPFQPFHLNAISDLSVTWWNAEATITWSDPWNLVVDGQTLATWASTKLIRKVGSAPSDSSDWTLVITETVADTYSVNPYTDSWLTNWTTYYYKAFSVGSNWLESGSNGVNVVPRKTWDMDNWTLVQTSSVLNSNNYGGIFFNNDGTKIYLTQYWNGWRIYESPLQNPYDLSSISFSNYFTLNYPEDIHFSPDGVYMFIIKSDSTPYRILRYTLSTPWDISSASQDQYIERWAIGFWDRWLYLSPDWTKLYVWYFDWTELDLYTLSTPRDLSTASTVTNVGSYWWNGIWFGNWGKIFFRQIQGSSSLDYYILSTPYDFTSITDSWTKNVWESMASGMWFDNNGTIWVLVWWWGSSNYATKYTL